MNKAQVSKVKVKSGLSVPRSPRGPPTKAMHPSFQSPETAPPRAPLASGAIHSPLRPKSCCAFLHPLSSHPLQ